ncbi:hypothetical protein PTE30175_02823 [Pandoraea terrae]|uniref:Uncharacterized protein n=1 Tax=Pandoraea terrae TaxID=1537710 RepID=A0A5E4VX51_9BURK|nr:hypothetical protein PTE30175_02823 [Pandoraea terrae]
MQVDIEWKLDAVYNIRKSRSRDAESAAFHLDDVTALCKSLDKALRHMRIAWDQTLPSMLRFGPPVRFVSSQLHETNESKMTKSARELRAVLVVYEGIVDLLIERLVARQTLHSLRPGEHVSREENARMEAEMESLSQRINDTHENAARLLKHAADVMPKNKTWRLTKMFTSIFSSTLGMIVSVIRWIAKTLKALPVLGWVVSGIGLVVAVVTAMVSRDRGWDKVEKALNKLKEFTERQEKSMNSANLTNLTVGVLDARMKLNALKTQNAENISNLSADLTNLTVGVLDARMTLNDLKTQNAKNVSRLSADVGGINNKLEKLDANQDEFKRAMTEMFMELSDAVKQLRTDISRGEIKDAATALAKVDTTIDANLHRLTGEDSAALAPMRSTSGRAPVMHAIGRRRSCGESSALAHDLERAGSMQRRPSSARNVQALSRV